MLLRLERQDIPTLRPQLAAHILQSCRVVDAELELMRQKQHQPKKMVVAQDREGVRLMVFPASLACAVTCSGEEPKHRASGTQNGGNLASDLLGSHLSGEPYWRWSSCAVIVAA